MPYNISKRAHISCPLIDTFHVRNILGGVERRQLIFGSRQTVTGNSGKALTLSGLTGGLITNADHYQVLAQHLDTPILEKVRIASKIATGFTLIANEGDTSLIVVVTLPTHPRATPKDAWNYCPYCKYYGFKDIEGSIVRDATLFAVRATTDDGSTDQTFAALTDPTKTVYGAASGGGQGPKYLDRGSLKKPLVTQMADDDYQIIITKSTYATAAVTTAPYPSSIGVGGFTLNGDANQYYDILILGQVQQ